MVKTRIGISSLLGYGGSIELPEQITLCCPQCGTQVADKGQCSAELIKIPDPRVRKGSGFLVELRVDCRNCGQQILGPALI